MNHIKWLSPVGLLFLLALSSCQTVEYTGRRQVSLISESQEKQLGTEAYQDILKKTPISNRSDWQAQLQRVGQRIAAAAAKPDYQWEFKVLQGKEVNAFCLPGGKVAFWEGIMPVAQDDNGVAVIMGHEVAHALARHGAERMSQSLSAQVIGQILTAGVGMANPAFAENFAQLYGLGTTVGVILPWGRAQESEADRIGLILMAKAGYDPSAAVGFWERMSKASQGGKAPEFLSTHPSDETRINQIRKWLPEAQKYYKAK
ncbi:MAG TPA: M48 family metallopeptidase [Candidatus Binatia bacterium]|nr:M48 family metallopeptidase [Candidatus Binatia bacterium]